MMKGREQGAWGMGQGENIITHGEKFESLRK